MVKRHGEYPEPPDDLRLGVVIVGKKILFRLWAPEAEHASVAFFDRSRAKSEQNGEPIPINSVAAVYHSFGGWWEAEIPETQCELPIWYEWTIGRSGQNILVPDPWARATDICRGDYASSCRMAYVGPDSHNTGAASIASMERAGQRPVRRRIDETIVYEVHVRDLTMGEGAPCPPTVKGTFRGAAYCLDPIADLGVTHIQVLPIQRFGRTDESFRVFEPKPEPSNANYNWGYDPIHYFAPSLWYAGDPANPLETANELRHFVAEAHRKGLRVIFDVVYNHAYDMTPWEAMAPGYWFRRDVQGIPLSNSGCGNDFETTRPMFRKLLCESLVYLIDAFGADGFRFDLMGLIDRESMLSAYARCKAVLSDVLFIGEGWKLYNGPPGTAGMDQHAVESEQPVAVFNDELRDLLKGGGLDEGRKGFLHGTGVPAAGLFSNLIGLARENYQPLHPWNSVNYIECHDGLTAFDNICFNLGLDPDDPSKRNEAIRRLALGNLMIGMTPGILFFHAGQEWARSKRIPGSGDARQAGNGGYSDPPLVVQDNAVPVRGDTEAHPFIEADILNGFVRNSYRSGDGVNALRYVLDWDAQWLREFTKGVIAFRKNFSRLFASDREQVIAESALSHPIGDTNTHGAFAWTRHTEVDLWLFAMNSTTDAMEIRLPAKIDMLMRNDGIVLAYVDESKAGAYPIQRPNGISLHDGLLRLAGLTGTVLRFTP